MKERHAPQRPITEKRRQTKDKHQSNTDRKAQQMTNRKKLTIGLVAAVGIFAAVFGTAATLGGINSDNLGADSEVVASCDTDGIDVAYTTGFNGTDFTVTSVDLSDIAAACEGQTVSVALDGAELTSGTADDSGSMSFTLDPVVTAESVEDIAILITG
jgi:hypothetical protein